VAYFSGKLEKLSIPSQRDENAAVGLGVIKKQIYAGKKWRGPVQFCGQ